MEGSPAVSLSLSLGAPLQALAIQPGQKDLIALRQKMIQELYSVVSGNGSPVNVSSLWSKMALMDVLAKIISWLADIIRVKMYLPDEKLINKDVVGELKSLSRFFDLPTLFRLRDTAQQLSADSQATNLNQATILADFLCTIRALSSR